jgi:cysteine desulfurase
LTEVYLDYNASSPLRPEVAAAMAATLAEGYGNPSSIHRPGHRSKMLLESARESVASLLGARLEEIVFTSGGTEANNLALFGAARISRGRHLVSSAMEHSSVLAPLKQLEEEGYRVTRVAPDGDGVVDGRALLGEVSEDTALVSLMHSSNEVGTLQPVGVVAGEVRRRSGTLIHADAVQSAGKLSLNPRELGLDLVSLSAHKLGGPQGVGCLWVRQGVSLAPILRGGGQESNRRAGTEALSLIAGFGAAAALARSEMAGETERLLSLRDALERNLLERIPGARIHGYGRTRLPNTTSLCVAGCSGEEMLMALDLEGIAVSTGSACGVGTVRPSHVLTAMGCSEEDARCTLRISLGIRTIPEHLNRFLEALLKIVTRIRGTTREAIAPAGSARKGEA